MEKRTLIENKTKNIISNTNWMVMERVIQMLISLFVATITARYLGPQNYGLINYAASYTAFFTSICTLGLDSIIVKQLVDKPQNQGLTLGTGIIMRIISSLISIISILFIVSLINPDDKILLNVVFLQSIGLLFKSFDLIDFWYQSMLKSKVVTIIKTISYLIVSSYKIFILILQKNILWFAFSNTLDVILISVLILYSYYRNKGQKLRFSFNLSKDMIKISYHFIISGLMVAIYGQMDKLMLGKMIGSESVGNYSIGMTICNLWYFIPNAIIASLRPSIMEYKSLDNKLYEKKLTQLYSIVIWMGIFYAIFINLFSKTIVLILYGKEFIDAVIPMNIMVWYGIFSILGVARDIWIICEGYQKYAKYFAGIGSLSNFILNLLLIPNYGVIGASIATLITQIITGFIVTLLFKDTRISNKYIIDALLLKNIK